MTSPIYDDPRFVYDQPHLLYDGGWITTGGASFRVGGRGGVAARKAALWPAAVRALARQSLLATPKRQAADRLAVRAILATLARRASAGSGAATARPRAQVAATHGGLGPAWWQARTALAITAPIPGHLGRLGLRGATRSALAFGPKAIVSYARLVAILRSRGASVAVRPSPPTLLPLDPLAIIDLGCVYRGDTLVLPVWQARDQRGNLLDLTDALIWFTAKQELDDADLEPPSIQVSTADGWVTVLDAEAAIYRVVVPPSETQRLLYDTHFTFDVQVQWGSPLIRTIRRGILDVVCDVTRAMG